MITILIIIAVLLFRFSMAAALSVCLREQQESGVVFRLGKVQDPARGPGLTRLRPLGHRMTNVSQQVITVSVPAQTCVTKDDMLVRVDAVVHVRVLDAGRASARDYQSAISRLAQTSLRAVIGRAELDDLLSSREKLRAKLTEILDPPSEQSWRFMPHEPVHTTSHGPVGPQDAPLWDPWDAARGPQDAIGGPQDAVQADVSIEQVEQSVESPDTLTQGNLELLSMKARDAFGPDKPSSERCSKTSTTGKRLVVDRASTNAVAKSRGTAGALREHAADRRMLLVTRGRDDASGVPGGDLTRQRAGTVERTILDSLPRPVAGPAYLGGRDDAAYLRGWDDAVDWIRQGNQAHGPSWGSAAYMTGWNDGVRAIARARCG